MHVTIRLKRGIPSLRQPRFVRRFRSSLSEACVRHGFRVVHYSIQRDHVHLLMKFPSREAYRKFIRGVTGTLARKFGANLWAQLPFTRLFTWQSDYWNLKRYMKQNREETLGHRPYKKRKKAG